MALRWPTGLGGGAVFVDESAAGWATELLGARCPSGAPGGVVMASTAIAVKHVIKGSRVLATAVVDHELHGPLCAQLSLGTG